MNRRAFLKSLSGALAGLALFRFTAAQGVMVVPRPITHTAVLSGRMPSLAVGSSITGGNPWGAFGEQDYEVVSIEERSVDGMSGGLETVVGLYSATPEKLSGVWHSYSLASTVS